MLGRSDYYVSVSLQTILSTCLYILLEGMSLKGHNPCHMITKLVIPKPGFLMQTLVMSN